MRNVLSLIRRAVLARRGSTLPLVALSFTALAGMGALAVDLGSAYAQVAKMQKVADAAAVAGALAYVNGNSDSGLALKAVQNVLAANTLSNALLLPANGSVVAASPRNSANKAVKVTLSQSFGLSLAKIMNSSTSSISPVASATVEIATTSSTNSPGTATICILSKTTGTVNGTVDLNGCSMAVNDTGSSALTINSGSLKGNVISSAGGIMANACITATEIRGAPITAQGSGSSCVSTTRTGSSAVADPYAAKSYQDALTALGALSCQNFTTSNTKDAQGRTVTTLSPGCYTNVNVNNNEIVKLGSSGQYRFNGININSGGAFDGSGVSATIYLDQSFSPSGPVTVTAPSTGALAGIAIYAKNGINFNSSVTYSISGAIYAPTSTIIPDAGTWNMNNCTFIVANQITFNSGARFTLPQTNCSAYPQTTAPSANAPGSGTTTTTTTLVFVG